MRHDLPYSEWKHEIKVWQAFTNIEKSKMGPALFLSLSGSARDAAREVSIEVLNSGTGLDELIKKLDELYLKDENNAAFEAYDVFERYERPSGMSVVEYINTFERLYQKAKHYKLELPDGVLAYRLLRSANLSDAHQQLARATLPSLTYANMQTQLKKIFADSSSQSVPSAARVAVKVEPMDTDTEPGHGQADTLFVQRGRAQSVGRGLGRRGRSGGPRFASRPPPRGSGTNWTSRGGSRDPEPTGQSASQRTRARSRQNPRDARGNVTTCAVCNSWYHWAKDCPDRAEVFEASACDNDNQATKQDEEVFVTLFTRDACDGRSGERSKTEGLLGETLGYGIIDSGCSKTVCGEVWYKCHLDAMSSDDAERVLEEPSSTTFRFGNGEKVTSLKKVTFPALVAGKKVRVAADVVPYEIPLLLSKESLKKCDALLDFSQDTAVLFGTEVKLSVTSNGHYVIPVAKFHVDSVNAREDMEQVLFCSKFESANEKGRMQIANRLHRQFGHPRSVKLQSLCLDAGVQDKDFFRMLDSVEETCDVCKRHRRSLPRPVVGFGMARDFNDTVALDLKQWGPGIWFCHMIDLATRYSTCEVVKSKDKHTILRAVMTGWIARFGAPSQFLSDNGGEFNNEEFREMAEAFNIRIRTTAAESPWSNGINEKYNGVIASTVKKVMDDTPCSLEVALAWAVSAKNSLETHLGFSPNQLVFGRNPNNPACFRDKPPALEPPSGSDLVRTHLNAMHSARQAFIQNESSEKLKRALLHQVRPSGEKFCSGDVVLYRRHQDDKWRGPGVVIGQENKQILVKHGGVYYRCHASTVVRDTGEPHEPSNIGRKSLSAESISNPAPGKQKLEKSGSVPIPESIEDSDDEEQNSEKHTLSDSDVASGEVSHKQSVAVPPAGGLDEVMGSGPEPSSPAQATRDSNAVANDGIIVRDKPSLPRGKSRITYVLRDSSDWKSATVLGRAGKATGKYKFFLNVLDDGDEIGKCVDWRDVDDWKPLNQDVLVCSSDDILTAKLRELENWEKNDVYSAVPDEGQHCISCRWVITEKGNPDGSSYIKARLVARGFEEDTTGVQTDSPTCGKESLRVVLAIAASQSWSCHSIDVKAAFLQGSPLEREVFLRPPSEANAGSHVWKMKTCVYGLNDASRYWYLRVRQELLALGMVASKLDAALFYWRAEDGLEGIITCHVDDFLWCGSSRFEREVIQKLRQVFLLGSEESEIFRYLGLHIHQQSDKVIKVNQMPQAEGLQEPNLSPERRMQKDSELSPAELTRLRGVAGQINWLATQTRPDLSFDVCDLSCSVRDAKVADLQRAAKVVRKAQSARVSLKYPRLDLSQSSVVVYSDASYGNLPDGSSQGGYIVFLRDNKGRCAPLAWSSSKIKRIVRSTLAAECMALQDGADAAVLLAALISEALYDGSEGMSVMCCTDSRGLYRALYSTKAVQDKRLRIDIARMRQMLEVGEVTKVSWVDSSQQLADCLTKKTASSNVLLDVLKVGIL